MAHAECTLLPFDAEDFTDREQKAISHAGTFTPPVAHAYAKPVSVQRGAELQHVTVPTLIVQGGQDPLNPPPHGRHLADLIPSGRLIEIPELGHALPKEILASLTQILVEHFHQSRTY